MHTRDLFLAADADLRRVVDRLTPEDLARRAPSAWSASIEEPTLRDILAAHAYDEAWIPDVLAGGAAADGDPHRGQDLLGDDPVTAYDALNDRATAAVQGFDPAGATVRFTYGDYPAEEGLTHMAAYRAFQAWSVAHLVGQEFHLTPDLVDGLNEHVVPHADEWRQWGVFPPAIDPPAGADDETVLLCAVGYWEP